MTARILVGTQPAWDAPSLVDQILEGQGVVNNMCGQSTVQSQLHLNTGHRGPEMTAISSSDRI